MKSYASDTILLNHYFMVSYSCNLLEILKNLNIDHIFPIFPKNEKTWHILSLLFNVLKLQITVLAEEKIITGVLNGFIFVIMSLM